MTRKTVASSSPAKLYRSIREVSAELGVKPHVLRYWETQFPSLHPKKNRAGNRIYRPEEIVLLGRIKELLYARRFTIEGARKLLIEEKKPKAKAAAAPVTPPSPTAPSAKPAPDATIRTQSHAERERLEAALVAANAQAALHREALVAVQAELAAARESLAATSDSLLTTQNSLTVTQGSLATANARLVDTKASLASSEVSLAASKESLAVANDLEKTRAAAMAVLRQELLLLARELRGEDEEPARAAAEPRVAVKTAAEPSPVVDHEAAEPAAEGDPVGEEEPAAFPVGAVAITVGA
ncbi:MAG TPA: MerR family transcriptional regulator [Candidatus Eisenbacteria bacterium]|nr:MerR family transcriptional regulator [Candidatus Eisenbacteria bacterium]